MTLLDTSAILKLEEYSYMYIDFIYSHKVELYRYDENCITQYM